MDRRKPYKKLPIIIMAEIRETSGQERGKINVLLPGILK
jgi:hypothetical protein